jgi:hypothetical protein
MFALRKRRKRTTIKGQRKSKNRVKKISRKKLVQMGMVFTPNTSKKVEAVSVHPTREMKERLIMMKVA